MGKKQDKVLKRIEGIAKCLDDITNADDDKAHGAIRREAVYAWFVTNALREAIDGDARDKSDEDVAEAIVIALAIANVVAG